MPAYRYVVVFPREWDCGRGEWPLDLVERVEAIPGVRAAVFDERSAAWAPPGEEGIRRESRQRVLEVLAAHDKGRDADAAQEALLALLRPLGHAAVARMAVEAVTVL